MFFQAVFFFQIFLQKLCKHFSSTPCVPHAPTISIPFLLSPNIILWTANIMKLLIVQFLSPPVSPSSYVQILPSAVCTQISYRRRQTFLTAVHPMTKLLSEFRYINQRPLFLCIDLKLTITIIISIDLLLKFMKKLWFKNPLRMGEILVKTFKYSHCPRL